jgi:L-lactate dehydrogenase complex protein LldF
MHIPKEFLANSEEKAFSSQHRNTLRFNISKYDAKVLEGKTQFLDLEKARQLAKNTKWYAIDQLPRLLEEFEKQFTARGGKVIWAEDAEQALAAIGEIMEKHQAQTVVKSKSMITEEIELNHFLEQMGVEVLETDLGEYIVQLREEPPYHIVTPAMHLTKEEIAALFHEQFQTPIDATPEQITAFVRKLLREKFEQADIGITGVNFLVAQTGSVALTENEGNARLATTFPKVHIAIAGIEKVLPSLQQLDLFWPLLSTYGTGQKVTVYNSLLNGPRQADESDGPEEMYVILLDNGRTLILEDEVQRQSLYCIRCGSCLNACPVYRTIGGHSYDSPYGGPIGSVIMPNLTDFEDYTHLSHASTLCGACTENCPVNIDLHHLLVHNRRVGVQSGQSTRGEGAVWRIWKSAMLHRGRMNAPRIVKNLFVSMFFKKSWGPRREFPAFPKQTFNQLWKKNKVK